MKMHAECQQLVDALLNDQKVSQELLNFMAAKKYLFSIR